MNYTLVKERYGFYCKYTGAISPDDFFQAILEVNVHPYFKQAAYCIHDFLEIDSMRKGKIEFSMILAHSLGASVTNSIIKIGIIAKDENAIAFFDWYKRRSDENVAYFETSQDARDWTCSSPSQGDA